MEVPNEISKNFEVLKEMVQKYFSEGGIEKVQVGLKDLSGHDQIVQLLHCDIDHFKEFMETFEDVISVNENIKKDLKKIYNSVEGESQMASLRKGANNIIEILFRTLNEEINDIENDDEIKESFDKAQKTSAELSMKLKTMGDNKENLQRKKPNQKKILEEKLVEKKKQILKEETKVKKDKILQQSKDLVDRPFEMKKSAEVELICEKVRVINRDCPPLINMDCEEVSMSNLDKVREETGLEVLGGNADLRSVYAEWADKPMLRVMTHESKQEIENNQRRQSTRDVQEEQGEVEDFLKQETRKVEDSVDLFGTEDYMYDLYMSGNMVYRDIERRYLFPYSDSLERYRKTHMLSTTRDFYESIRRNVLCYEREVSQNFEIGEFHRMTEDQDNATGKVLIVYIFNISKLSNAKDMEVTANFFGLSQNLFPIQGTVAFCKIPNFYVFEGQYICVYGDFSKGTFNANSVLPFDPANVVKNLWDCQSVEVKSNGAIKMRQGLERQVKGEVAGQGGWSRGIQTTKTSTASMSNKIVEEVPLHLI
jgi:hypothetical protein